MYWDLVNHGQKNVYMEKESSIQLLQLILFLKYFRPKNKMLPFLLITIMFFYFRFSVKFVKTFPRQLFVQNSQPSHILISTFQFSQTLVNFIYGHAFVFRQARKTASCVQNIQLWILLKDLLACHIVICIYCK